MCTVTWRKSKTKYLKNEKITPKCRTFPSTVALEPPCLGCLGFSFSLSPALIPGFHNKNILVFQGWGTSILLLLFSSSSSSSSSSCSSPSADSSPCADSSPSSSSLPLAPSPLAFPPAPAPHSFPPGCLFTLCF